MSDELQFFRDEVLGKLGYSDEDSEIDPLQYARREIGKLQKRNKDMAHEIQELRKVRANLTAERERNRWIPVGERLPEYRERVEFFGGADLTAHIGYYVPELPQWTAEDGGYFHGKNISLITHWRPIVPPESEEK